MKDKKGMLICFTGIDGSGKTTLAKALVDALTERNISVQYVYGRLQPLMLKPVILIGRLLFLRGKDMFRDYTQYSHTKRKLFDNHLLSLVYERLLLLDHFLQIIVKIKIPLMMRKNVICDRYIYDTVITDLVVDLNYSEEKTKRVLKNFASLLPKPNLIFLIDLSEEIAYQRKNDVPSVDYLIERRRIYLDIQREYGMIMVDGCQDLTDLSSIIQYQVTEYLNQDVPSRV